MEPLSTRAPAFLGPASSALARQGEVLVQVRYAASAGLRAWRFVRSPDELHRLLEAAPARASVTVYLGAELPLRGRLDAELRERIRRLLAETGEVVVGAVEPGGLEFGWGAATPEDLDEAFRELDGKSVAAGRWPPFAENGGSEITAFVPDADGQVRPGAY